MKLRTKMLLAQLPLALALVAIGWLAITTLGELGGASQTILQDNYRSVLAAQRMKEACERMDSAALFKLSGHWDQGAALIKEHRARFEAELRVEEGNITEQGEKDAALRLRQTWQHYQQTHADFAALDDPAKAEDTYYRVLYPAFLQLKQGADDILALNQDAMMRKSNDVHRIAGRMNHAMLVSTIIAAMAGLIASGALTRRLLRPLSVLSQATHRLGEGDLAARAQVSGRDEIGQLAGEFNTMAEHLEKYRRSSLGELFQAQQTTQAAIDSLPDPVLIFDPAGQLINVNAASETLLGLVLSPGDRDPLTHLPAELRAALGQAQQHVLGGQGGVIPKSFDESIRVPSINGERWFMLRAHPLYGEQEGLLGVTVLLQDVTRLRRFDELKTDLVSTVAHELRTPLTSLHMAIHLCLDETAGELNDRQADLLYAAREDCQRLQTMVDDLLDLSRIQSGRVEMKRQPMLVRTLLENTWQLHHAVAIERDVKLEIDPQAAGDEQVSADAERIALVLTNLVTNAIRHTPAGGTITLRAERRDDYVRFEVSDTGEGIAPEYQPKVFDKFFRVPGSQSMGVGLGLSICREVIAAHRGEIGVESEPGQGSTFWFTLPWSAQ
jgi:signal transduction histidine kinase